MAATAVMPSTSARAGAFGCRGSGFPRRLRLATWVHLRITSARKASIPMASDILALNDLQWSPHHSMGEIVNDACGWNRT
jgi:hypothetical protein